MSINDKGYYHWQNIMAESGFMGNNLQRVPLVSNKMGIYDK